MIFTLVTAVQEKLNEIVDLMKNRQEEEKRRKEREAEEAEKVRKKTSHMCSVSQSLNYLWLTQLWMPIKQGDFSSTLVTE